MLHKLLKVECVSPTLPVTASHLHTLPTSVCQICTSKQGQHFLFWRKKTGDLEPLLMGCNLEEELAPDGMGEVSQRARVGGQNQDRPTVAEITGS